MGFRFQLKSANIVAYITDSHNSRPPRLTAEQLWEFLGRIKDDHPSPSFISSDPSWLEEVMQAAGAAHQYVSGFNRESREYLEDSSIERALVTLKRLLSDYELFGLVVGSNEQELELEAFVKYAALSSGHHAIFLIPDDNNNTSLNVLDPFPPIALLASQPGNWPGILFWSRTGQAAFAELREAEPLYEELKRGFRYGIQAIDKILGSHQSRRASKKILQLSDLHFGKTEVIKNQGFLSAHLQSMISTVDRVAITGDLFDNPKDVDATLFNNFRSWLMMATGKDIIVIPGNHDEKLLGNSYRWIGRDLGQLVDLEWSNLVVDDDIECVFFCFDSSKDADWARGKITTDQLRAVSTLFETKCATKSELRNYLPVALIHHHPFSFEANQETKVQRALRFFRLSDERFLQMEDAESFLRWCARRKIPLILHGHKHVQRYNSKDIEVDDGGRRVWREVAAVGCGTSLGAENLPMSYNILAWDPVSARWGATFFADPGDFSGFTEQQVTVHRVAAP